MQPNISAPDAMRLMERWGNMATPICQAMPKVKI